MTRVYIQEKDGQFINENCFLSATSFEKMGYSVTPYIEGEEIIIEYNSDYIFHGNVNSVRTRLKSLGVKLPSVYQPHVHLPGLLGREMFETTLGRVKKETTSPVFIKPLYEHKLFTGRVIKSEYDLYDLPDMATETGILQSEVINYISEYRCFILEKELIGAKHYYGDFKVLPDFNKVFEGIKSFSDQPIAYSLDFGITDTGSTQLIEINDAFSLGAYGLNGMLYCRMIEARWFEMIGIKNK